MNPKELIIKCYAKQTEGVWVAVSLEFGLATQGASFEEAKRKLEEQIYFYVDEALQDKEYGSQLLGSRAPLSSWIEYYLILLLNRISYHTSIIFDEMMPMRPA